MHIQCIRWCMETCTWREDTGMKVDATSSSTRLQLCREKKVFIPYCTSRMGLNDDATAVAGTPVKWIAVFCTREDTSDLPYHAHQFPFPFNLPLYPQRDLYFCMYTELQGPDSGHHMVPFTLGRDMQHPGNVGTSGTTILPLKLDMWHAYCTKIKDDRNLDVYATLQAAFDTQWAAEDVCDDDFVADEEVATDLLLLQQIIPGTAAAGAGAGAGVSSTGNTAAATDDEWNEDDAIVDALTGFVVEPQHPTISDDEVSTDNSSEEEDNEDAEEDDDDDEADGDDCIDEDDGAAAISLL